MSFSYQRFKMRLPCVRTQRKAPKCVIYVTCFRIYITLPVIKHSALRVIIKNEGLVEIIHQIHGKQPLHNGGKI